MLNFFKNRAEKAGAEEAPPEVAEPLPVPEAVAPEAPDVTEFSLEEFEELSAAIEAAAGLEPEEPTVTIETNDAPPLAEGELEEWVEPLELSSPEPLAARTELDTPFGTLSEITHAGVRGALNRYTALLTVPDAEPVSVRVLEEAEGGEILLGQEKWRKALDGAGRFPMIPALLGTFASEDRIYLVEAESSGETTLAALLNDPDFNEVRFAEILLLLVQVAAFLVRLHGAGYAHLALRPEVIIPGKPVQITDSGYVTPIGQPLGGSLSFSGYSAPELAQPGTAAGQADIYAVGAMIFQAVSGEPIPETGVDFSIWQPRLIVSGVPQLLRKCLGPAASRFATAEELHLELVRLKNRLRPQLDLEIAAASTIGLEPSRTTNQDAYSYATGSLESDTGISQWAAFCVADGMGGMAAGEVASEVAAKSFVASAQNWAATLGPAGLTEADQVGLVKEWARDANQAVVEALGARGARGGCTLEAVLVVDRRLCLGHVGDSRIYLIRDGVCEPITRDHSYVMSLLLQGEITFEEIRSHPDRNKVTRSLGERHPQPDFFVDTLLTKYGSDALELKPGDVVLACSDGLWEPVTEAEMVSALAENGLKAAARQLLRLALERGAPDNATVVLLKADELQAVCTRPTVAVDRD